MALRPHEESHESLGVGIGAVPHRVMVHVKVAGGLWLPAASWASTEKVWLVELRPEYPCGLEQALNALPSSWHQKVTPA
jgi:hypothetical protein